MPSTTLTPSEPTAPLSNPDPDVGDEAQRSLEWLARTARWQRRLNELRGDTA